MITDDPQNDERLELALHRSWRAVEAQRERLADFRGRSATLLGSTSIAVAVLAGLGETQRTHTSDGWAIWSISWFAISLVCSVLVLVPRKWVFESDPNSFSWYFENATAEELRSSLLADARSHYNDNHSKLTYLGWVLTAQVVALGFVSIGVLLLVTGGEL